MPDTYNKTIKSSVQVPEWKPGREIVTDISLPVTAEEELSELDKNLIKKYGWTPEQLKAVRGADPTQFPVLERYKEIFKKPEIDERSLQRNRTIGIIGDGLKILGQMYGAGKGARIERLDPAQSLTSHFAGKEEEARERYRKSLDEWNRGYYGAALHDVQTKNNHYMNQRNRLDADSRHAMDSKKQEDRRREDVEWRETVHADNKEHQKNVLAANERQQKAQNAIHWANIRANQSRNQSANQSGNQNNDFVYLNPNKNDPTPVVQQALSGKKALPYPLSKTEIESTAAQAKTDREFVKKHPELFRKIKLKDEDGNETAQETHEPLVNDKAIATAYLQEIYDAQFSPLPAPQTLPQPAPQTLQQPAPQTLPQPAPQTLPQPAPQTLPQPDWGAAPNWQQKDYLGKPLPSAEADGWGKFKM